MMSTSRRLYWIPTVIVLLIVYALLTVGFTAQLPYHLNPDEPVLIINANELVTAGRVMLRPNYPPFFVWQLSGQRLVMDALAGGTAGDVVYYTVGRVASVSYGLLFIATAIAIFRRFGAPVIALGMGLFVALEPIAIRNHAVAKADAISLCLATMTIWCSLQSWLIFSRQKKNRRWSGFGWLAGALLLGGASALSKYNFAPVLAVPGLVLLVEMIRRRWWGWLIAIAVTAGFVVMSVVLFTPLSESLIVYWQKFSSELGQLPALNTQWRYFIRFAGWLGSACAIFYPVVVFIRHLQGRATALDRFAVLLIVAFVVTLLLYASANFYTQFRHSYLLYVYITLAIVGSLQWLWQRNHWIVPVGLLVVMVIPRLSPTLTMVANRFDITPEIRAGNWLVEQTDDPFNVAIEFNAGLIDEQYSGVPLGVPVGRIVVDSLYDHSLDWYRAQGVDYLIADSRAQEGYMNVPPPATFEEQTREVYRDQPTTPRFIILDLLPPPRNYTTSAPETFTPVNISFGEAVGLDSYQLSLTDDGDTLQLDLAWAGGETDVDYIYFVQITDPESGTQIANINQMPLNYQLSTSLLHDDEILVDPLTVSLTDAPDGCYRIDVGWYNPDTGTRLPVITSQGETRESGSYRLPTAVHITPQSKEITACHDAS